GLIEVLCNLWDVFSEEEREMILPRAQRLEGLTAREQLGIQAPEEKGADLRPSQPLAPGESNQSSPLGKRTGMSLGELTDYLRRSTKELEMIRFANDPEMSQVLCGLWDIVPLEERASILPRNKLLEGLSVEERLQGLSDEEILGCIPISMRLAGIPPE